MTYELAKQLKDAGFKTLMGFPVSNSDDGLYYPTLSELIEACGDRFALHKNIDHWVAWIINSNPRDREAHDYQERGSTPEEAVANLWLALNKK